jgi:hypothetical protein
VRPSPPAVPVVYLGIDPGVSGGLACIRDKSASAIKMPASDLEVWEWVRAYGASDITPLTSRGRPGLSSYAVLEKVGGYLPASDRGHEKYEGTRQPGSHMFRFGASVGAVRMALVAAGFVPGESLFEVAPVTWQKAFNIVPRGKSGSRKDHKAQLKQLATDLFPSLKVTLKTADALLLAEYCRRLRTGRL